MSTGDITRDDSFGSSNSPRILRSDSSFEIINDSLQMAHNSLTPLRTNVVNPLQEAVEQNKQLKKLLEDCEKKMTNVREDQDTMLQNLDKEKKKCNALEEETVRLQVVITSLDQKLAEVSKQRDDAIKDLLPSSPVKKAVTNDHDFSVENNKERIKIDAMRQSKMEMLAKNFVETKQRLEECQEHLKSKDNDLLAARKKIETMRSQTSWLEETLAEERARKIEKENELSSIKRMVAQLNMKLSQETSSYDEATKLLSDTHNEELNNVRADYNKKMDNLQQMNSRLQQQVDALKQDNSTKDKERQDMTFALEAVHRKEIEDFTNTNTKLNRELGAMKMSVQEKETTLSQLERERNSLKETVELMRQQIQSYGGDFDVERQSREQITIDNSKLKQRIKDMELQLQKIREDYATERSTRDLVATENKRLKQELNECKNEHALEKTRLLQQIEELQQKQGSNFPLAQQGNHFPLAQQGSHFPPAQQGSHFPLAQQGSHFPPAQQGSHGPPLQQESGYVPRPQQSISQSGIPHHPTNASTDMLRPNSNAPPPQRPIPPEHRRQVDDATVPADAPRDSTGIRYPPDHETNTFVCPICQRSDFDNYETLRLHAAYCGVP